MKKKLFVVLLVVVSCIALAFGLAACGGEHTHTYSADWSSDETHHWHAATCEHTDEMSDYAEHTWSDGAITTPVTCTATGVMTYTCTACEETRTEPIAIEPDAHTWDDGEVTTPATCTATGVMTYTCTACEETRTEPIAIEPDAHTWDDGEVTTPATCTATGVMTYTCTACEETRTEPIAIEPDAHVYSDDWTFGSGYHWHACTAEGCTAITDYAAHTMEDNACTVCEYFESQGLAFTLNRDSDTYTVSGIGTCTDTDISIPAAYSGKAVTAIAGWAFYEKTTITSVFIPDSVTSIGECAFA